MQQELLEIREQQKQTWNKFSGGWKKWDDFTMQFLKPMGDAIIAELDLKESDTVLDVASGNVNFRNLRKILKVNSQH